MVWWRNCLIVAVQTPIQLVQDTNHAFLALFPHRFDYIWAPYPDSGERVEWRTESRHPLSDRLIQQASYLYGVRFGAETSYCLLDVDSHSLYHPSQDPFAISRMVSALEPLGLMSYVACTSSYSGGLHLYFPFCQAQSSWKLSIVVSTLLENAGFKVKPGQLEVFPDPKPYNINGQFCNFNAHRLPLQIGSYLVNLDFQPVWSDQLSFLQQWKTAQTQNCVKAIVIGHLLKQIKRQRYSVSTKAEKFINDLNAEIELGWTGGGQTNYLLGRIAMREYIFRHVLTGGQPLEGNALVNAIVDVAQSLPGYTEYCRHRHEIHHRAQEWARCIENSRYFHYGDASGRFKAKLENHPSASSEFDVAVQSAPTWNQQQQASARDRIRRAIAQLLEQNTLPANPTARFQALIGCGIGGGTLYKHRDLWHPAHLNYENTESDSAPESCDESSSSHNSEVSGSGENFVLKSDRGWDCFEEASQPHNLTSLLSSTGRNPFAGALLSDSQSQDRGTGRNHAYSKGRPEDASKAQNGMCYVQQVLDDNKARREAQQTAACLAVQQQQRLKQQACEARHIARMQQFLDSNDPILVAEAISWAQVNPGVLEQRYGWVTNDLLS